MPKTPQWLQRIVNSTQKAWEFIEPAGVLGCRWQPARQNNDAWLLEVYPTATEVLGGRNDGEIYSAAFNLDLAAVLALYTETSSVLWGYPAPVPSARMVEGDLYGPTLTIDGFVGRRHVKLIIYAWSPHKMEATALYNELTGEIRWRA